MVVWGGGVYVLVEVWGVDCVVGCGDLVCIVWGMDLIFGFVVGDFGFNF